VAGRIARSVRLGRTRVFFILGGSGGRAGEKVERPDGQLGRWGKKGDRWVMFFTLSALCPVRKGGGGRMVHPQKLRVVRRLPGVARVMVKGNLYVENSGSLDVNRNGKGGGGRVRVRGNNAANDSKWGTNCPLLRKWGSYDESGRGRFVVKTKRRRNEKASGGSEKPINLRLTAASRC